MNYFEFLKNSNINFKITFFSLICVFSPDVQFCGYTISHPTDNKIHFRIQANKNIKAIDVMRRGLEDLEKLCDYTIETFEKEMGNFNSDVGGSS